MDPTPLPLILLADDEEDIREMATMLLENEGYRLVTANDGQQTIEMLEGGLRPAAILLDLMMPKVTGWEVWDWLQQDPAMRSIPVVVWTGSGLTQGAVAHARVVSKGNVPALLDALRSSIEGDPLPVAVTLKDQGELEPE